MPKQEINESSHLAVILTNKCNLNCQYCLRKKNFKEINYLALKNIIQEARELGYQNIGLTGGEPLLYSRLHQLFNFLEKLNFHILLETNGILLNQKWIDFLKKNKEKIIVSISLDSGTEEQHDKVRGKGSYSKAVLAIKRLVRAGLETRVISVLTQESMQRRSEIINYLKFCQKLGVSKIGFQDIVSVNDKSEKIIRKEKNFTIFKSAVSGFERRNKRIKITYPEMENQDLFCPKIENRSLCISPSGIHPCIFNDQIRLGSLRDFHQVYAKIAESFIEFRKFAILSRNCTKYDCENCIKSVIEKIKELQHQ